MSTFMPTPDLNQDLIAVWSQEAEEAVIGSVLISPDVFAGLQGILRPGDFFLTRHNELWQTFSALSDRNEIMDLTTIGEELRRRGTLEDIGGPAYIVQLLNNVPNSMHADAYAKLVKATSTRRKTLKIADEMRRDALNESIDTKQVLARADRNIFDLNVDYNRADASIRTMEQVTTSKFQTMLDAEKRFEIDPDNVVGVRTGFADLDLLMDGLRVGITTLAGPTGSGKSAMFLQIARFASRFGLKCGPVRPAAGHIFSGEMTEDAMVNRILSSMTGIPVRTIERGSYTKTRGKHGEPSEKDRLIDAMEALYKEHRLTFESGARMSTAQIRQRVRTLAMNNELDWLGLDGLLQIEDTRLNDRDGPRRQAYMESKRRDVIEGIMNDLEAITLTYKRPILMTHQLSRAAAGRANKRPVLSDLAEANFVEQKSAVILFLYREGYYDANCANPYLSQIIVAKNRFGSEGDINLIFDPQHTQFLETEHVSLVD